MKKIKQCVDLTMLIVFISILLTGVIKFLAKYGFSTLLDIFPRYWVDFIHDWGGLILLFLIAIHLILHHQVLSKILSLENVMLGLKMKIWYIIIVIAIILLVLIGFWVRIDFTSDEVKELQSKEIQEYQGEDLSSITDLRENSIKGPQYIDIADYHLQLHGLLANPSNLTYDEALSYPKYSKVVTLNCVEGWSAKILWEGIKLSDLLNDKGIKRDEAKVVIFRAADGYSTSLPIDYIYDNDILLAYKQNGLTLSADKGFPFQVVAEEKYGYKWAKWITEIEVSSDENYRGTWEHGGYNNDADINGPKRESF